MKKIKLLLLVVLCMFLFLTSCSASADNGSMGGSKDIYYEGATPAEPGEEESKDEVQIAPGQLTACAYDDNEHFAFWQGLITSNQEGAGLFQEYHENYTFKTQNRIKITVPKEVPTKVSLLNGEEVISTAHTDASGVCYIYAPSKEESYNICLEYYKDGEDKVTRQYDTITGDTEYNYQGVSKKVDAIQIMFVIDTTGSMGDELSYIKSEVIDIMTKVEEAFPLAHLELAVMVYRDTTDEYITKYSDFTTDFNSQREFLSKQSSSGGGDFEEAVQTALTEAANKQWSDNAKTKLLFHIADAPAHNEDISTWTNASKALAEKDVHIITVASSGIDKKTEYLFRSQSLLTNGKYVYLTDDSGIGGSHLEATVEKRPVVEYLNACLIRLVKGYYTGTFEEPILYSQVIDGQQ